MKHQNNIITLGQGDLYFGEAPGLLRTVLGSCVAVTLWHPQLHVGGMCHVVLPEILKNVDDYRYASSAIEQFIKDIKDHYTHPKDYQAGIYGGANMFPGIASSENHNVGEKNIQAVQEIMLKHGFTISEVNIGGAYSRRISLNLDNGETLVSAKDVNVKEKINVEIRSCLSM